MPEFPNPFVGNLPERKMSFNELITASGAKREDVIRHLVGLREKKWVEYDLTITGDMGSVWLISRGIKVTKDIHGN